MIIVKQQQQTRQLGFAEPVVDDLLKHSLREQLEFLTKAKLTDWERRDLLQQSFTKTIEAVLQKEKTEHHTLTKLFTDMYDCAVLSMAQAGLSQELLTCQYVSESGLIMSPLNCRTTIKDIYRIRGFVRGVDKAVKGLLTHKEKIHILYPACGPFAPLILPLLQFYKEQGNITSEQLKVTLVDIQPGAILALRQLINDLSVSDYIEGIVEQDATQYVPQHDIDLLLLEAMQHGFTKEGQLSIAKHLIQFLSIDGWLIPKEISVRGILIHGETEFNQQWKGVEYAHSQHVTNDVQADRVELGEILKVSKSTLLAMKEIELDDGIKVVEANTVLLPTGIQDMKNRIFAMYARVETFDEESVEQYDSGISHPLPDMTFYIDTRPKAPELKHFIVNSGDAVKFYYQLTGLPRFIPTKASA